MKKKDDNKSICCNVYDCCHCDTNCDCCTLKEIKVCNCNDNHDKEATMCDSFKERK